MIQTLSTIRTLQRARRSHGGHALLHIDDDRRVLLFLFALPQWLVQVEPTRVGRDYTTWHKITWMP